MSTVLAPLAAVDASPTPVHRFPVAARSVAHPDPAIVSWWGPPGPLQDLVRDRVEALGARLLLAPDGHPDPASRVIIAPAEQLRRRHRPRTSPAGPTLLVVSGDEPLEEATWAACLEAGAGAVLRLPDRGEDLLDRLGTLLRPRSRALVLGVHGGCGGAGASSTAARLAGAAARAGRPAVLVDADPCGGGLDVLVEAPPTAGVVWDDLGPLDAAAGDSLMTGLPVVDGVRLLTAASAGLPDPDRLRSALGALSLLDAVVVIDLGADLVPAALPLVDRLLLVVPAQEHAVRAARRRCAAWTCPDALLGLMVRRRGPLGPDDVAEDLQLPLLASFRDGPAGLVPLLDVRRRGADRACEQALSRITERA